jgi:hypothetical protein
MAKGFKFPAPKGYAKGGMCSPKGAKAYAKGGPARGTNMEASDMYDPSDLRTLEAGQNVPRENKNRMRSESVQNAKAKADLKREYDDMYSFNPGRMLKSDVGGAYTRMRATEDQTGEYKKGGKVKKYADGGKVRSENTEYAKALDRAERSKQYEPNPGNEPEQEFRQRLARNRAKGNDIIPAGEAKRRISKETGYDYESKPDDDYGIERLSRAPYKKGGKAVMSGKMKMGRKFAKMADGGEVETEQSMSKATRVKMPKGAAAKGRAPRTKGVPVAPRGPMIPPQAPAPMAGGMSPLARVAQARAPMAGGMGMKMGGKAKKH